MAAEQGAAVNNLPANGIVPPGGYRGPNASTLLYRYVAVAVGEKNDSGLGTVPKNRTLTFMIGILACVQITNVM